MNSNRRHPWWGRQVHVCDDVVGGTMTVVADGESRGGKGLCLLKYPTYVDGLDLVEAVRSGKATIVGRPTVSFRIVSIVRSGVPRMSVHCAHKSGSGVSVGWLSDWRLFFALSHCLVLWIYGYAS
ncbi:hypothetical protein Tco_0813315 [Tanacetum coccineum]